AAFAELEQLNDWSHVEIERVLRESLIDGAGLKPRVAFGPLRTSISGRRISPPLFESMEILGKKSTLARLERLRTRL
ncbi:MAG: glutamate--tRNA ligase, partial [Lacisediminihabitans sp.]